MPRITDDLSKKVGWFPRPVAWPFNLEEVEAATDQQLLEWYRFLSSPEDDKEMAMINLIIEKLF